MDAGGVGPFTGLSGLTTLAPTEARRCAEANG